MVEWILTKLSNEYYKLSNGYCSKLSNEKLNLSKDIGENGIKFIKYLKYQIYCTRWN